MQGALDGDNSASARKLLAKAQKILQLVSMKRHALAQRDFYETLEECVRTESSSTLKILGYRMAARVPTCTTHETWQLLLDASVTELASSQNAPVLLYSMPVLEQIPLPLIIGFLIASEKEPMNKLRAVLQHEQTDVRCCAIQTIAKVTLDVAFSISNDGLYAFPFESQESRIVCQQDLWTLIADVWRIIFQSLVLADSPHQQHDVAGAAFSAMRLLFGKTAAMSQFTFTHSQDQPPTAFSAANDLASFIYKEASPRIRALVMSAQRLPMKNQVDAAWWLAMLLHMMMDRSGAKCPGVSVPYLEIDVMKLNPHDDDDDDAHTSTERARMDQLAADVLETWLTPLLGRNLPLAQSANLCRAIFIVLSHPLQSFTRNKAATLLVQQLVAQCFFHKVVEIKLEMSHFMVRAFAWLSSDHSVGLFVRVVEAIHLMERESDRHDLLQLLMEGISHRVTSRREFLLLESITALDIFHQAQGSSKLSPRTSGSNVYKALVQALLPQQPDSHIRKELQVAQIIVLKAFIQVLLYKTNASIFSLPQTDSETQDVLYYMALLSEHYQSMVRQPDLALKESLSFYQQDLQRAWRQISSCAVRLQLLWIGIQLSRVHQQLLPSSRLLELMNYEVSQSFSSSDDERDLSPEAMAGSSSSAVFDDGKLGGGSSHGVILLGDAQNSHRDEYDIATTEAVIECLKALHRLDNRSSDALTQLQTKIRSHYAAHLSAPALQMHILDEAPSSGSSNTKTMYAFDVFRPSSMMLPPRHRIKKPMAANSSVESPVPLLVTGSSDPLAIHVSFRHPLPGHEDVIQLCVTCCNASNMALSDFEVHIRMRGPVRCIDPSNDLKIRLHQGGAGTSVSLAPFAVLKSEKRFLVQRFAQAVFYFQLVFQDGEGASGGDESSEAVPVSVAASNPFIANYDTLFRRPHDAFTTGAYFQQVWRSAEDSVVFDIESSVKADGSLSFAQRLLKQLNPRVAAIPDLLIDLPIHTQITLLTKTRWDESVAVSLTLSSTSNPTQRWKGVCEIRSTKLVVFEFAKNQQDALRVFGGTAVRVAPQKIDKTSTESASRTASVSLHSASRTASRLASRSASIRLAAASLPATVDPFAGNVFPAMDFTTFVQPATDKSAPPAPPFDMGTGDPFATDQLRPTAPVSTEPMAVNFGGFDAFTASATANSSDPWQF